jgi:hypothetical protein
VHVSLTVTNLGRPWPVSTGTGQVLLGVQALDADGRLLNRDHHRVALPGSVSTGEAVRLDFDCPAPSTPARYQLKFDLVVEGVTWFEQAGSRVFLHRLDVTEPTHG